MKIDVDYTRCTGHGLCELEAADIFEVGEDGLVGLLIDEPGEEYREQVQAAIKVCPTVALSLRD